MAGDLELYDQGPGLYSEKELSTRLSQGDFRQALLLELALDGKISRKDVDFMLENTNPGDDVDKILGVLLGSVDSLSGKDIERSLADTEFARDASEIEEQARDFDKWLKDAGHKGLVTRDATMGYMASTGQYGWNWWKNAAQLTEDYVITPAHDAVVQPLQDYYGEEQEADRANRTMVRNKIRDEIDALLESDDISKDKAKELRSLTGDYGEKEYSQLMQELNEVYLNMDDPEDEMALHTLGIMNLLRSRGGSMNYADTEDPDRAPQEGYVDAEQERGKQYGMAPVNVTDVPSPLAPPGQVDPDAITGYTTNYTGAGGYLDNQGYGFDEDDPRIDIPPPVRAAMDFMGERLDIVFDPATGREYTIAQWENIKNDKAARADYLANKVINPATDALLRSGRFGGYETPITDENPSGWSYDQVQGTGQGHIPLEPGEMGTSLVTGGMPYPEAESFDFIKGQGSTRWLTMSASNRGMYLRLMNQEGLLTDDVYADMTRISPGGNPMNLLAMNLWEGVIGIQSSLQKDPISSLRFMGDAKRQNELSQQRRGSGRVAPKYSVPASLRELPDYKTLAEQSKQLMGQQLGRDPEDWEMKLMTDELGDGYSTQNKQRIAIHKEAWDDAVAGGSTEVDFSEVTDPGATLQYDIDERYADEIDRNERVENLSNRNRLLMDSVSVGQRMI